MNLLPLCMKLENVLMIRQSKKLLSLYTISSACEHIQPIMNIF